MIDSPFPRHVENVQHGRCTKCGCDGALPWHFGELQQLRMCRECGNEKWERMLAKAGRLAEWLRLVGW